MSLCFSSGARARSALCATVAKVLKVKTWVVKLEEELEVKLEELEVKTRLRRRSRCLEANSLNSSRSLTGFCTWRNDDLDYSTWSTWRMMIVRVDVDSRVVFQDGG